MDIPHIDLPRAATRLTLWLALMGCLLAGVHATTASAAARNGSIYWGAVIGSEFTGTAAPYDMAAVSDFTRVVSGNKGVSIVPMYEPFEDCSTTPCTAYGFPTAQFSDVRSYGAMPMVSWGSSDIQDGSLPFPPQDPAHSLRAILAGRYDKLITTWAQQAKAWGHPFFLRFDWEMDGNWFVWGKGTNGNTATQFRAVWRHVHDIFTRVGATNATWVWCPNDGNTQGSIADLASFYPGNSYVNWTCTDAYNQGTSNGGAWQSWNTVANPTYASLVRIAPTKPVMIAEFGSSPYGGNRASWLTATIRDFRTEYRHLHAVVYFDTPGAQVNWVLNSAATHAAFARAIASPVFTHNTYANLDVSPIPAP